MSAEGSVLNISHVQLNCSDLQASVDFFKMLGFKVERIISDDPDNPADLNDMSTVPLTKSDLGSAHTVGMGLGDDPRAMTKIELMQWVDPIRKPADSKSMDKIGIARIALTVKGLPAIVDRLVDQGLPVEPIQTFKISSTIDSRYVLVEDPDGNCYSLMEWIKIA